MYMSVYMKVYSIFVETYHWKKCTSSEMRLRPSGEQLLLNTKSIEKKQEFIEHVIDRNTGGAQTKSTHFQSYSHIGLQTISILWHKIDDHIINDYVVDFD